MQKEITSRALHTFIQAFLAVFLLGATGVASSLLKTHNLSDAETATLALSTSGIAAGISAVKTALVQTPTK